jgi:hypothetical protein
LSLFSSTVTHYIYTVVQYLEETWANMSHPFLRTCLSSPGALLPLLINHQQCFFPGAIHVQEVFLAIEPWVGNCCIVRIVVDVCALSSGPILTLMTVIL